MSFKFHQILKNLVAFCNDLFFEINKSVLLINKTSLNRIMENSIVLSPTSVLEIQAFRQAAAVTLFAFCLPLLSLPRSRGSLRCSGRAARGSLPLPNGRFPVLTRRGAGRGPGRACTVPPPARLTQTAGAGAARLPGTTLLA